MPKLCCPKCKEVLWDVGNSLRCQNGHSYDRARQGYVNLLMSNAPSSKRHGDDREMVLSRKSFLEKGYYEPLLQLICDKCVKYGSPNAHILDAGCGEGWYTASVKASLPQSSVVGVDISKEAIIEAAKRRAGLELAVASVSSLPVQDNSCDIVLSIFAPDAVSEFRRVMRSGGYLIRAVPMEEHLLGLKKAVYDEPYLNPPARYDPEGFTLAERAELRYALSLTSNEDISELFRMTPYYYKTGREDQAKLLSLETLETEAAFCVFVLKKV
ncbi:MAG: methyltransferase domain-containing protein [Oscillospiraceae bacterium]|nr:methyltransferase domain-containing protein [Oscillospiraceae bacterium]